MGWLAIVVRFDWKVGKIDLGCYSWHVGPFGQKPIIQFGQTNSRL